MGKSQRRKGVVGEQDVAKIFRANGFLDAKRTGVAGQENGDIANTGPYMVEVKRSERLDIPGWWAKLIGLAEKKNKIPLLVYRRSSEPWKVTLDLDYFLNLTGGEMFSPGMDWRHGSNHLEKEDYREFGQPHDPDIWADEPSAPAPSND